MRATLAVIVLGLAGHATAQETISIPPELEGDEELIFASTHVGSWSGFAMRRLAPDYEGNSYHCAISAPDAMLTFTRGQESTQLNASWSFLYRSLTPLQIEFTGISIGRQSYEMTDLPWRLIAPAPGGIVLSNELSILVFRKDDTHQWLPVSYLSDNLMEASKFTISFTYESDDETPRGDRVRKPSKRTFDLRGFKEVSKWCGQQLLADRLDEKRVNALVE